MLAIAVAVGVVATFGTPFGGIIFSIEVTAAFYMVGTLWKSFLCATFTLLVSRILFKLGLVGTFLTTSYDHVKLDYEIVFYAILGLLAGRLAATFNHVLTKIVYLRVKLKLPYIS